MNQRRTSGFILLLAPLLAACGTSAVRELESVTPAGDGRFWATGSSGYAVYYDGRQLVPRDYPMSGPDWGYEPGSLFPATQIRIIDGDAVLFSRSANVLRWRNGKWEPLKISFPREGSEDQPEIDRVLELGDGRLLVQIHSELLLRGTLRDFEEGHFESERAPTFFTDIQVANGRLYALGWDETGNIRAVYENAGQGWWLRSRLTHESHADSLTTLLILDDGVPVATSSYAFLAAGESPRLAALGALYTTLGPGTHSAPLVSDSRPYIGSAFSGGAGNAVVFLGSVSQGHNTILLEHGTVSAWSCNLSSPFMIGAFPHGRGFRAVSRDVAILDVPGPGCRAVSELADKTPAIATDPEAK